MSDRNNVSLVTYLDGEAVSHFKLREFENAEGIACVHPALLKGLEQTRAQLCRMTGEEVSVIITDGIRTQADLERLGEMYGWTDDGGTVSRTSKHLLEYGGIAADIRARRRASGLYVEQALVGNVCREFFDRVIDTYGTGHVHVDQRIRAQLQ